MSFIKKFIDQEKVNRRDLLFASAYGLGGVAALTPVPLRTHPHYCDVGPSTLAIRLRTAERS